MDDVACRRFFLQPTQTYHRQYEALRAFFVEHRPLGDIARHFGYSYDTVRSLVRDFRSQCLRDDDSPFSPPRGEGGSLWTPPWPRHPSGNRPPSLMPDSSI
jgi:hypothetical protein